MHGHDDDHRLQPDEQRLSEARRSVIRRRAVRSGSHASGDIDRGLRGAGGRQRRAGDARLALARHQHSQRAQREPAERHSRRRPGVHRHQPAAPGQSQRRLLRKPADDHDLAQSRGVRAAGGRHPRHPDAQCARRAGVLERRPRDFTVDSAGGAAHRTARRIVQRPESLQLG